jgi:hypothetical protein
MASRLFALITLLLIVAAIAGYLVAAGWIPWTYPIALFLVGLILWGFVALRRTRRTTPTPARALGHAQIAALSSCGEGMEVFEAVPECDGTWRLGGGISVPAAKAADDPGRPG